MSKSQHLGVVGGGVLFLTQLFAASFEKVDVLVFSYHIVFSSLVVFANRWLVDTWFWVRFLHL